VSGIRDRQEQHRQVHREGNLSGARSEDWCFINTSRIPTALAIKLAPGRGRELQQDMEKFIDVMMNEIPRSSSQGVR